MRLKAAYAVPALAVAAGFSLAFGGGVLSEYGPSPSYTGAAPIAGKPAEENCTLCHMNTEWNNLNTPGGAVEILDLPWTYAARATYRIRVRLSTDSTAAFPDRDWGFQLTAVRAFDGEGCGTFVLDDSDSLQILLGSWGDHPIEFGTRQYVEHTLLGDRDGLAGPTEWTFSWTAPDTAQGTVIFYCAGNATNGSTDPLGDFIFTDAESVLDVTPALPVSWGALKKRYR